MAAAEASVLVTLDNSTLSALHDGELTELGRGPLSLAIGDVGGDDQVLIAILGELEFLLDARVKVLRQGATRISWPASGEEGSGYIVADLGGSEGDRETFDAVLASWTSFSGDERMNAHKGQLVLVDEKTGAVVAEVDAKVDGSSGGDGKDPVLVETNAAGDLFIAPLRASYGQSGSRLIGGAETVSRGVLFLAEKIGSSATGAASRYTTNNPATDSPIKFNPTTQKGLAGAQNFTGKAVKLSGKAVGALSGLAGSVGDSVGKTLGIQSTPSGKPPTGIKGGINKGLIAFNTVWDSLDAGGRHVLASTSTAGTTAIGHRYGPEAGSAFQQAAGGVTNVALVYIDVRGIGKRALLKTAGKSAIRAKLPDGRVVELGPDSEQSSPAAPTPARDAKV